MQCKDIPEEPILTFLAESPGWATWHKDHPNSVLQAMPDGVTAKMARIKMGKMIRKGLVLGCACGCCGDFRMPTN